jgi:hypothetical protein
MQEIIIKKLNFYFLLYVVWQRIVCDLEDEIHFEILTDLQDLSPSKWDEVDFGIPHVCVYVCMYVCMCASL